MLPDAWVENIFFLIGVFAFIKYAFDHHWPYFEEEEKEQDMTDKD